MELQKIIDNEDYMNIFKENNINVRKYSKLRLIILRTYPNHQYDYTTNPWIRYCRGAIINTETNRVVCIPPLKSEQKKEVNINDYNENEYSFEPLIDGTMINMFYHDDEWMISTRSNIGAKNSWDGKVPFYKLFESVNGVEWYNQLKKDHCYSFVLHHKENRIVSPINENSIFLVEMYDLSCNNIKRLNVKDFDTIDGITNNLLMNKDQSKHYLENENNFSVKGFTIKTDLERIKWMNPNYEYVNSLKKNFNNKFLSYVALRQEWKLSEYLKYFPEERYIYNLYRERFSLIKDELYQSYIKVNITKKITRKEVKYPLRPLVHELHQYYLKTKHKINMNYINEYMQKIPGRRLLFIYNQMF